MASVITIAGEQLFAAKAQANEQLDIDTFIFAHVPNQDPTAPINREEGIPTAYIVHQQIVQQVGRINENVVVYSTVLDSLTGPFDFNWVGLYSSVNQKLVAVNHVPTVTKTETEPGAAGNTLNRNFGIEYSGIADLTGITVAPETWQLDFTARLSGMDRLTQQLAADMNGKDWFIENGFKVVPRATVNTFSITPGVGYVSGLRIELKQEHILTVQAYPQFVYVDAWFSGTANSTWIPQIAFTVTNGEMEDYIDPTGVQHYVFKLSQINAADAVEDLRSTNGLKEEIVNHVNNQGKGHDGIYSRNFKTVAKLKSGEDADGNTIKMYLLVGCKVFWRGYYAESDGGSNWGIVKSGAHVEDGGSIFSIDANTYIEANIPKKVCLTSVRKFGARTKAEDSSYDIGLLINRMLDDEIRVRLPEGLWSAKTPISYTKFASINTYYSSVPPDTYPTVVMHGQHKDNTIIEWDVTSAETSDYIMQVNSNPNNASNDAYLFNPSLKNFTIRGTGVGDLRQGLKIRGWWHGNIKRVKVHRCLNGIYVDGKGTAGTDDHDTVSFLTLDNVSLINNNDSGFKAMKSRPSGLVFNNCELRANGKYGYHGGMASVTFNGGSISLNGSAENEGGLYVTTPASGAIPRGLNINGTTFEANYNFEIWTGYLTSGAINHPIFTPFENAAWSSTTKSIIKILEAATTTNEARFSLTGARVNAWSTSGQPISFVRSNSNFGKVRVKEEGTQWNGNATQIAMVRYVFGSLDVKGYKTDINQTIILPTDGGAIANITAGTNTFTNASALITAVAIVDDGDSFAYSGGSFRCIKPGFYTVSVVLPVGGLTASHAGGYALDIRVGGVQVAYVSRTLPLTNGQYDVPFSLSARVYLELNEAPTFFCRIEGSDTNPVTLKKNGIFEFSVIEI